MASAIVPIVLAAAPLLEPFIKGAILHAQKWFGYNNGTDQEKLNTVLNAVLSAASSLTAAGKIPDKVTPELAITLIENTIATMKALGAVGCITNGSVRDIEQVRDMGFQYHAAGITVSHGQLKFHSAGDPVRLGRLTVRPGDLIHADLHGVVIVPFDIADDIPAAADKIFQVEAEIMELAKRPGFKAADLKSLF